ncbi:hypothetical protein PRIC2_014976 [Phytophthora ramorum]
MDENSPVGALVGKPYDIFVTRENNLDFESAAHNTTVATIVVADDGAYHNGLGTLSSSCVVSITARDINESPLTENRHLSIPEGVNSDPLRVLTTEIFVFPIISSRDDYSIKKNAAGVYSTDWGRIGEVSSYDRSSAMASVLEITVTQVSRVILVDGVVPYMDPDVSDTVHFAIIEGNPVSPVFFVDKNTGELTANIDQLDFESESKYALSIAVTDRLGLSSISTVTVDIEDVNEPPVVHDATCFLAENAPPGTSICIIDGTDPDT